MSFIYPNICCKVKYSLPCTDHHNIGSTLPVCMYMYTNGIYAWSKDRERWRWFNIVKIQILHAILTHSWKQVYNWIKSDLILCIHIWGRHYNHSMITIQMIMLEHENKALTQYRGWHIYFHNVHILCTETAWGAFMQCSIKFS